MKLNLFNSDKTLPFETPKDLLMFFQTVLRNVGLYTSISFACLGYSRYYRSKSSLYSIGLVAISIMFLVIAMLINSLLIMNSNKYKNIEEYQQVKKWEWVSISVLILQIILLLYAVFTLVRLSTE